MSKIDELLQETLKEKDTPSAELNRRVLEKARMEERNMALRKKKMVAAAAVMAGIIITGGTGYAAYRYMTAGQTAEYLGSKELSTYFKESDVVASKKDGNYRFRYLGNASAKLKESFLEEKDKKTTYVAMAIDRLDGKPMTQEETFVASPLIQGLNPIDYNVYTMGGGAVCKIKDGVLYMIMSVNNIEMFADRDVYLAITKGVDYADGYQYKEETGEISENESFDGINVLFTMRLDESKADKAAQDAFLQKFAKQKEEVETEEVFQVGDKDLQALVNTLYGKTELTSEQVEKIAKCGTPMDSYKVKPDKDGNYQIKTENSYGSSGGSYAKEIFDVGKPRMQYYMYIEDENALILVYDLRNKNDVLQEKYYKYTVEQAKDAFAALQP
ncbi:hypothetical protein SAMN02910358_01993 [Lachnospiraceae bacterium XBB1006]|nr:hypothetical protein SAMN02910358_01993 [Lachnospiraceae bacterium XBB1006]